MKTNDRGSYAALLDDEETTSGGLALAGWGIATIAACVLGFAAWQYAPPRSAPTEVARADSILPDPSEVTGSIAQPDRGQTLVTPSRVVGAAKVAPMPLASNETVATSRDIEQLRSEIKELQRRIVQMGLSGDGVSRRVDRLEEKLAGDPAAMRERLGAQPTPPDPTTAVRVIEPSRGIEPPVVARPTEQTHAAEVPRAPEAAPRIADRIPLPAPRPGPDEPMMTGSVPPRATEAPSSDPGKGGRGVATTTITPVTSDAAKSPAPAPDVGKPVTAAEPAKAVEAPVAAQPGEAAALDLGGYRTLGSLQRSWSDMTSRYAEFGAKMEPLARLRETESGMEARLLAGPYSSQAEAAKSCIRLRALGVTCAVTGYSGQPLTGVK